MNRITYPWVVAILLMSKTSEREDGQLLILTSDKDAAAGLSTLPLAISKRITPDYSIMGLSLLTFLFVRAKTNEREDGHSLILPSVLSEEGGGLSARTLGLSCGCKDNESFRKTKTFLIESNRLKPSS